MEVVQERSAKRTVTMGQRWGRECITQRERCAGRRMDGGKERGAKGAAGGGECGVDVRVGKCGHACIVKTVVQAQRARR